MPKVLIIYDSRTGNTEEMAKAIASGVKEAKAEVKKVSDVSLKDLEQADAIVLGSPTHFGTMSEEMKKLINNSVKIRGKLENKMGAAFTSSGAISGGNETTLISLLQAMLIHGMIVVGDPIKVGGHYGVVAIGKPDKEVLEACKALGGRVGELAVKIAAR
ncbi:flavodoxin [Mesotoga sp. SC_3PWM13N19]|nr:flavodoxin [Peptococcaceae bacterium SCADC1_2_3]RAM57918.1 flavodoxin [Mesotoga sp. SC_3PWM13N19]HBQ28187.1 flavodoxin [Desulfotomaculum sp.]KFI35720.1 flavodoxin [Peptococcaceae bacterium SCADC1_2_3]KFI37376.1 flavodoxin [Peptococcaceae bacterium SCADC1_2_3]